MPRYFFHVQDNSETRDDHGIVLPDEHAAKRHGVMMLGQILRDEPRLFWASGHIGVTATTNDGVVLFTLETTADVAQADAEGHQRVQRLFPLSDPRPRRGGEHEQGATPALGACGDPMGSDRRSGSSPLRAF